MSFRHSFKGSYLAPPRSISVEQLSSIVDVNGVSRMVINTVPADSVAVVPSPKEYRLEVLLASGIPLNILPTEIVESIPSDKQIDNIVNNLTVNTNE